MSDEEFVKAMQEAHSAVSQMSPDDPEYGEAVSRLRRAVDAWTDYLGEQEPGLCAAEMSIVRQQEPGVLQTGDIVMVSDRGVGVIEILDESGTVNIHMSEGVILRCVLPSPEIVSNHDSGVQEEGVTLH